MKKIDNKLSKLATYSAAAAAVFGAANPASAELIGYDMDPDSLISLDTAGFTTFVININSVGADCDELSDIYISVGSYTTESLFVFAGAYYDNQIIGEKHSSTFTNVTVTNINPTSYGGTSTTTTIGTSTKLYPTVGYVGGGSSVSESMATGDDIWQKGGDMVWWYSSSGFVSWGDWGGKTEKYMGLRFYAYTLDTLTTPGDSIWDSTLHYGWVYMDVALEARSFNLRAWAFETEEGEAAICDASAVNYMEPSCSNGTKVAPGISERQFNNKISIYSHNRDVRIKADKSFGTKGSVAIYDITGKKVQEERLTKKSNIIRVNGRSEGIYFVRVNAGDGDIRTQKVYIH
ncbi:MAG: T9SS type A sorting domain-containing protein [Flavobacteriales bacterium]|nr:T9SS type A sorting domain-containing protein [Flavobacteriales bacterium]